MPNQAKMFQYIVLRTPSFSGPVARVILHNERGIVSLDPPFASLLPSRNYESVENAELYITEHSTGGTDLCWLFWR
jgi:hypothetical protein